MLEPRDALDRILAELPRAAVERVPLLDAFHRVAAEEVRAPRAVPPHDDAAMDGYAVRAEDARPGATLRRLPSIAAGSVGGPLPPGAAAPIMTGAPVPPGADAVVIVEDTEPAGPDAVRLREGVQAGANLRRAGQDIAVGAVLAQAGDRLSPARLGLLASVGLTEVAVAAQPRVALLATGDELVAPGQPLGPGQIYSSNPVVLAGLVADAGGRVTDLGQAADDLDGLVARMERGLGGDALLTTGGVSVGRYDHVKAALARLGARIEFWKVRLKPGKPLVFGWVEREGRRVAVFGLPGNPVSAVVTFLEFVRPWLRAFQGDRRPHLPVLDAVAAEDIPERPGRAKLIRVTLERGPTGWLCRSAGSQSSGALSGVARAHGLLHRSAELGGPRAGERVRVQLIDLGALDRADDGLW